MKHTRAIIVGAGFGGLSAAALLGKSGFEVNVIEKNPEAGGRARVYRRDGFTFDMGPSWYLMPEVFERFFAHFGKKPEDYYRLVQLDPAYRMFFGGKDVVDVSADLDANAALFDTFEDGGAARLRSYLDRSKYQYDVAMKDFIYRDYRTVFDFFDRRLLLEGAKLRVFENMEKYVARHFESDRARKIMQYNLVFLGGAPKTTPALYSIMSHIDLNLGVWYPMGGLGKVVDGMLDLAREQGASFEFDREVTRIEVDGRRARRVHTDRGPVDADVVLVNADYHHAETRLLDGASRSYSPRYWSRRTVAPSAFIMFLGLDKRLDNIAHHNLFVDRDWVRHFDAIFEHPGWPEDPSYYVCAPAKTDPSVAPPGQENLFFLVPVAAGIEDTDRIRAKYREKILRHFEDAIGESVRDSIIVERLYAHRDFSQDYHALKGTALGISHTMRQTAVFRPRHRSKKVRNLYYTGQYTHPGIGMPMAVISSEIVAEEIAANARSEAGAVDVRMASSAPVP